MEEYTLVYLIKSRGRGWGVFCLHEEGYILPVDLGLLLCDGLLDVQVRLVVQTPEGAGRQLFIYVMPLGGCHKKFCQYIK